MGWPAFSVDETQQKGCFLIFTHKIYSMVDTFTFRNRIETENRPRYTHKKCMYLCLMVDTVELQWLEHLWDHEN